MLLGLAILFLIIWVLGLALHFLGGVIYLFLVLGIIFGIVHLLRGGRTRTI